MLRALFGILMKNMEPIHLASRQPRGYRSAHMTRQSILGEYGCKNVSKHRQDFPSLILPASFDTDDIFSHYFGANQSIEACCL